FPITTNNPGDEGIQQLSDALTTTESITGINLVDIDLTGERAAVLSEALKVNHSVTTLDCSRNRRVGDEGVESLSSALRTDGATITVLQCLHLGRCGIGDIGASTIGSVLVGNSMLQQLNLTGNGIGDFGAGAIMGALVGIN
ncbi:unnamed protein product, partial [Choristocarpus tenellus]